MKLYNDPARQKLARKVQQVRVVKQDQKFSQPPFRSHLIAHNKFPHYLNFLCVKTLKSTKSRHGKNHLNNIIVL